MKKITIFVFISIFFLSFNMKAVDISTFSLPIFEFKEEPIKEDITTNKNKKNNKDEEKDRVNGTKGTVLCNIAFNPSLMPILEGQCLNFSNPSSGSDVTWNWNFPGSSTSSSNVQNPQNICYNNVGTFSVSLTVTSSDSTCTVSLPTAITVIPDPDAPIVDFYATQVVVQVGGVINFVNNSSNGPFGQWAWEFEGGNPASSAAETPPPITYDSIGTFDVVLRGQKESTGVQKIKIIPNYIKVVNQPSEAPTANFVANNIIIQPGETINFVDMSLGSPFVWQWDFIGGIPATSTTQHPQNITYNNIGCYAVKLTVSNSMGSDIMEKICYITVANSDPCTEKPIADFTTRERLIPFGKCINFENTSTGGIPTYTQWTYEGGSYNSAPANSVLEFNPSSAICYETPQIYDVTLFVSNACGSSTKTKEKYIYVFSGIIDYYCEEQSPRESGESYSATLNPNANHGYIIGHSSERYRYFANYFDSWTFNQIRSIILPIHTLTVDGYNAYLNLCIWEPNGNKPADEPIYTQKVYLRDLVAGQNNSISLTTAVDIEGPFYAGFKINYVDANPDDGIEDDILSGYIINKGSSLASNRLFFKKNDNFSWETTNDLFGYSAAMMIKINSCLVDIEDFSIKENNISVFPNPTNSQITIKLYDNFIGKVNFELMDITGKIHSIKNTAISDTEYSMNLSNLPVGLYILKIQNNKTIITKKIIVTK